MLHVPSWDTWLFLILIHGPKPRENVRLCVSMIAQAGSKEQGDLSTGSYYPYTKVRHIISPHISLSNESNMPNFKEVRIVYS